LAKEAFDIALAIIRHPTEQRYLIALRKQGAHLADFWEFPGGKCLPGESLTDCAMREAREEVGLTVTVLEAWPPVPFEYPERLVTLHPFLCRADTADAQPLDSRQVAWVAPSDLAHYPFPPANAPLLARLQEPLPPRQASPPSPKRTAKETHRRSSSPASGEVASLSEPEGVLHPERPPQANSPAEPGRA